MPHRLDKWPQRKRTGARRRPRRTSVIQDMRPLQRGHGIGTTTNARRPREQPPVQSRRGTTAQQRKFSREGFDSGSRSGLGGGAPAAPTMWHVRACHPRRRGPAPCQFPRRRGRFAAREVARLLAIMRKTRPVTVGRNGKRTPAHTPAHTHDLNSTAATRAGALRRFALAQRGCRRVDSFRHAPVPRPVRCQSCAHGTSRPGSIMRYHVSTIRTPEKRVDLYACWNDCASSFRARGATTTLHFAMTIRSNSSFAMRRKAEGTGAEYLLGEYKGGRLGGRRRPWCEWSLNPPHTHNVLLPLAQDCFHASPHELSLIHFQGVGYRG